MARFMVHSKIPGADLLYVLADYVRHGVPMYRVSKWPKLNEKQELDNPHENCRFELLFHSFPKKFEAEFDLEEEYLQSTQ